MYNYNISELNNILKGIDWGIFGGAILGLGILIVFVALLIIIPLYLLSSLALMECAKKNNINNAWLAFIPVGNMYILGKLGFEVYTDEINSTFTWVLFGCSLATVVFSKSPLMGLSSLGVLIFSTWAYYNIFKKINKNNHVLFTILSAVFRIGGVILFFNRKNFSNNEKNSAINNDSSNKEEIKYCTNCGNKINKDAKFCSKCGTKIQK